MFVSVSDTTDFFFIVDNRVTFIHNVVYRYHFFFDILDMQHILDANLV